MLLSKTYIFFSVAVLISSTHAQLLPLLQAPTQAPSPAPSPPSTKSKIGPWKCDLAQDGSGLPQEPYCCDDNTITGRYQDGRILAVQNCTAVPADQDVQCTHAADVWCCYGLNKQDPTLDDKWVCTSVAHWKPST